MCNPELEFERGYLKSLENTTDRLCRWQSLMEADGNKDLLSIILDVLIDEADEVREKVYRLESRVTETTTSQNPQRSLLLD